jgi:predicted DNA-binding ribbon-helix-helix protein
MTHGGPRPNAGRPNPWGRGTRLQPRTLRLPDAVWDHLDVAAKREGTTPAALVAKLLDILKLVEGLDA